VDHGPKHLYAQRHDAVDDVVVILLESLDSLLAAHTGLSHDKLNVFSLQTSIIDFLSVILFLLCRLLTSIALDGLALVGVTGVVVRSLIGRLCSELLGGRSLRLRVQVLDLGLAEDAVFPVSP
jgi:hypothetical protein